MRAHDSTGSVKADPCSQQVDVYENACESVPIGLRWKVMINGRMQLLDVWPPALAETRSGSDRGTGRANGGTGNAKRKAQEGARTASLWRPSTTTPAPPLPASPPLHPHRPPLRRQTVSSAEAVCDFTMLSRTAARASRAFGAGKSAASKTATVCRPVHHHLRLEVRRHQRHLYTRKRRIEDLDCI